MFGFGKKPEGLGTSPDKGLKQELSSIESRITELKQQMTSWKDVVPQDRDLLERLEQRKRELESQLHA